MANAGGPTMAEGGGTDITGLDFAKSADLSEAVVTGVGDDEGGTGFGGVGPTMAEGVSFEDMPLQEIIQGRMSGRFTDEQNTAIDQTFQTWGKENKLPGCTSPEDFGYIWNDPIRDGGEWFDKEKATGNDAEANKWLQADAESVEDGIKTYGPEETDTTGLTSALNQTISDTGGPPPNNVAPVDTGTATDETLPVDTGSSTVTDDGEQTVGP